VDAMSVWGALREFWETQVELHEPVWVEDQDLAFEGDPGGVPTATLRTVHRPRTAGHLRSLPTGNPAGPDLGGAA